MKDIRLLCVTLLFIPFIGYSHGDGEPEKKAENYGEMYHNWHHSDPDDDKVMGISAWKAYDQFLKGKESKKEIIVAVIDGGVDVEHEDLKANIWINEDEIDGNGKDDDNNGYIDDIYGWNFLGNADGENLDGENLEYTRIYRKLHPKYKNKSEDDVDDGDKEEYELYVEVKELYTSKHESYKSSKEEMSKLIETLENLDVAIAKIMGKKNYTIEELEDLKPKDKKVKSIVETKIDLMKSGLNSKVLRSSIDYYDRYLDYYLNTDLEARDEIIGDDWEDIEDDAGYGNPDVTGPDASHGTFVSGLIAAERGNGVGIDGIANNVKIMAIRAIPNGDEYDKDVALAIRYAVDNGANVINMSFGKAYSPQKEFVDEAIKYAESKGVLLVNAAGNDHKDVDVETHFPIDKLNEGGEVNNMITVGASSMSRKKDLPGSFSNYGKISVDVFAPGVDMVSCAPESMYDKGNGTSYASPVVSGVAALIWSYYPSLTAAELKTIILESVVDLKRKRVYIPDRGNDKPDKVRFGELSVTGGLVNVYEALVLAESRTK